MITIISGTNRKNSVTLKVASQYAELLNTLGETTQLLSLEMLEGHLVHSNMYSPDEKEMLSESQEKYLINVDKVVILAPEYNGGIPGILKLYIDACSVYKQKETFEGKKVALVGIASGRAGNLRGIDYLSNILNHLKVIVLPNKLPISSITTLMENDKIANEQTLEVIKKQAQELIAF